jgi:hypothetical protein
MEEINDMMTNFAADYPLVILAGIIALVIYLKYRGCRSNIPQPKKEVETPQIQAVLTEQPSDFLNWQMTIRPKDHPLKIEHNFRTGNWKDAVEGANMADEKKMSHIINNWDNNHVDNY